MTEQPVEHEQQFLGNPVPPATPLQAYLPNGHRLPLAKPSAIAQLDIAEAAREELAKAAAATSYGPYSSIAPRDRLLLEAEQHAADGVAALSNGELDEGIAWLQAALAFAKNYRHAVRFEVTGE
ncbi:hypothetical protein HOU96_gp39 [Arthrobacter phage Maja]|uniref:Uncharacterized protein n=1 Tax=Arthrobacter phage Maja TaxID=2499009 RepID=A0A3S9UN57_9CAUD|nr:hypothetical protein HOU96_gp39 [Arthrobacter phage Maja]AZS11737.1 hypothetical protein PBI_MAJA_39 [Arthrobacter phage Maja]